MVALERVKSVLSHAYCKLTRFCATKKAFVHGPKNTRCKGLTRCLAKAWPLPAKHPTSNCAYCKPSERKKRQAFATACGGLGKKNIASGARNAGAPSRLLPTEHGSLVDEQIAFWTQHGSKLANERTWSDGSKGFDAATAALVRYITKTLRWVPVAAQVPMLMPSVGPRVATAADLLCTDAATRSKVYLVEIKSTRNRQDQAADACYRAAPKPPAKARPAHVPRSQYDTHQGQLWAMDWSLRHDFGVTPDASLVLRARAGKVDAYHLDRAKWDAQCDAFLLQIVRPMMPKRKARKK